MSFLVNLRENKLFYVKKWGCLVLGGFLAVSSILLWLPSIFILFMGFFLLDIPEKWKKVLVILIIFGLFLTQWNYFLGSFNLNPEKWVAEEIPLLGIIYVIYLLPFVRNIPRPFFFYGIALFGLGVLKSKFMFLAVPFLVMGVLEKQLNGGIVLKREFFGVKEVPVLYICGIVLFGMVLSGLSMYPTQSDLQEMRTAIQLSTDTNQLLYNDWGDGWAFVSLGYNTKYKMAPPTPDWNNLPRPYLAWSKTKIPDCNYFWFGEKKSKLQIC